MLTVFAIGWYGLVRSWTLALLLALGLALASAIYFFGFSKLARNNVERINKIPKEKVCIFAFQKWSSYPLVLVMVGMGIYLRHYSPIPKPDLAVLYLGLGLALFASSIQYYIQVFCIARA